MAVLILAYHDLSDDKGVITVSPRDFEWQMRWLHDHDCQVIALSTLAQALREGEVPDEAVVITFDDGFESCYHNAFPILIKYDLPATVFITSGYVGRGNDWPSQPAGIPYHTLLHWGQIQEMARAGIEFGAHTVSHARLDQLGPEEAKSEILTSKADLEQHLGCNVELFAYPYGIHTPAAAKVVHEAYQGACLASPGLVDSHSDPLALPRLDIHYLRWRPIFARLQRPEMAHYVQLRSRLRNAALALFHRPWQ